MKAVDKLCVDKLQLNDLAKFEQYTKHGLKSAQEVKLLRTKWGGVAAFGGESMVHFAGFFDKWPASFLLFDAYLKRGHGMGSDDRACIDRIVEIRKLGLWQKKK